MGETLRTLLVGVGARGKIWSRLLADEPLTETSATSISIRAISHGPPIASAPRRKCASPPWRRHWRRRGPTSCCWPRRRWTASAKRRRSSSGRALAVGKTADARFRRGRRIVEAAEERAWLFAVGLNFRYQHCVRKAREIFASGELGAPSFSQYVYWRNRDGRRPGLNRFPLTMRQPMLYEQTIHHVDEIRYAYGRDVRRVWCRCHNPPWSMYRDDATVVATLELTTI